MDFLSFLDLNTNAGDNFEKFEELSAHMPTKSFIKS
jgi:hypothetical protein